MPIGNANIDSIPLDMGSFLGTILGTILDYQRGPYVHPSWSL